MKEGIAAIMSLLFSLGWLDLFGPEYTWWHLIVLLGE